MAEPAVVELSACQLHGGCPEYDAFDHANSMNRSSEFPGSDFRCDAAGWH